MSETKDLKENAIKIFKSALEAADPRKAVLSHLHLEGNRLTAGGKSYDLDQYKRIMLSGLGNYSAHMSRAVEEVLGERLQRGMVIARYTLGFTLEKTEVVEAGFPVPDQSGMMGTAKLKTFVEEADQDTLIIFLLSGGAPSLSTIPVEGIKLAEKLKTTGLLRKSGASLRELYTVQKHLSRSKGGQLTKACHPATMATLIMSDSLNDDLSLICAGLTVPDETTFGEASAILEKYELLEKVPGSVREHIEAGAKGEREETPKPGATIFEKVSHQIVASNLLSLESAENTARGLGYNVMIFPAFLQGEARDMGDRYAGLVKQVKDSSKPISTPACLLFGGETSVTKRGRGRGGPNQEVALATAVELAGTDGFLLLQSSTRGSDGNSDAAGAIVDGNTAKRGQNLGLDPKALLENNDSYSFFRQTGETFVTGPTDTDVMDVGVILIE